MRKYDQCLSMTFIKHAQTGTPCILKPLFLHFTTQWFPLTTSKKMQKKISFKWVLVVTELFNIAVNYFSPTKSVHYNQVLVVTKRHVSGTQCN